MKKFNTDALKASLKTRSFRIGGYSLLSIAIVLAIIVLANVLITALPSQYTRFDASSQQLFTMSEETKGILSGLNKDVTIYRLVQVGAEDETVSLLLDRYTSLSDKVKVETKDPDVYPTFAQQYTDRVTNDSLVVTCGDRSKYVDYSEIFVTDMSAYYYTGTVSMSFNGEGALTSAIRYVSTDELPTLYILEGHGETELDASFAAAVTNQNYTVNALSLVSAGAVPEDADCVLINAPSADISLQEKGMLEAYLQNGGSLLAVTVPSDGDTFANLYDLMAEYGMEAVDGIVIEGSQNNYAFGQPYYLLPMLSSHEITAPLNEKNIYVLMPIAQGLKVSETLRDGLNVSQLMATSADAFSKVAGYNLQTYEEESGDIDGPFALGLAATDATENGDAHVVWFSSNSMMDATINEQVSGGNLDCFLNALNWMCGKDEGITIHSKSLDTEYLTMPSSVSGFLTVVIVILVPVLCLGIGLFIFFRRKRK